MKTIKQLAKQYAGKVWRDGRDYASAKEYSIQDFTAGFEAAQRWISVSDELPEEQVNVLVKGTDGCLDLAFRFEGKWMTRAGKITHWRPINYV